MWQQYEEIYLGGGAADAGWNHPSFGRIRRIIQEEMEFLSQSVQVEEGAPCHRCKSIKTYTYQKQVRAADEGFTAFTICFDCNYQLVE